MDRNRKWKLPFNNFKYYLWLIRLSAWWFNSLNILHIVKVVKIVRARDYWISGVSRKSEWEGTKCQKITGNEIHWERIPPLWIPLSKFLYYILQGVAKNILGREVEIKGVRTYISSGYHRAPVRRRCAQKINFFSNVWLKIIEFKMKVFTSGVIAPQARKKRILHEKSVFALIFFSLFWGLQPL